MIMDDALSRRGTDHRLSNRSSIYRYRQTFNFGSYNLPFNGMGHSEYGYNRKQPKTRRGHVSLLPNMTVRLREARDSLMQSYAYEQQVMMSEGSKTGREKAQAREERARNERRYVSSLIHYGRATNQMSSEQARRLQKKFTHRKMAKMGAAYKNDQYLLGLFPRELY
jgi:hypothetical protein